MTTSAYAADENGNENRVLFWLRLDGWHFNEAALLFCDIDPDSAELSHDMILNFNDIKDLKGACYREPGKHPFPAPLSAEIKKQYQRRYSDMYRCLYPAYPNPKYDTPHNWISRALEKKIEIPWLSFAIEQGFYDDDKISSVINAFDKNDPKYPPELDLANRAWLAVANSEGQGKPKVRIREWLNKNTSLTNEAKERIAVVCNWEKVGGAPPTNPK